MASQAKQYSHVLSEQSQANPGSPRHRSSQNVENTSRPRCSLLSNPTKNPSTSGP
jgi:hypothetical protein